LLLDSQSPRRHVVILTDTSGSVHTRVSGTTCAAEAAVSNPGTGFFCFADSDPLNSPANDGLGLPVGPAAMAVLSNGVLNCGPSGSVAAGLPCGYFPATVTINVSAGAVVGQDIVLENKFAPAVAPSSAAGTFGYVVNGSAQGIGGVTVTATSSSAGASTGVAATTSQTGLWTMSGLTAATSYAFTISGQGLSATNVRPAISVTRRTGASGTWIDPSWIVLQAAPPPPTAGRQFGINVSPGRVDLSWTAGPQDTGYIIARIAGAAATLIPSSGALPATTRTYADTTVPAGVVCYVLVPVGSTDVPNVLCSIPIPGR
jgi:hypothetical protein